MNTIHHAQVDLNRGTILRIVLIISLIMVFLLVIMGWPLSIQAKTEATIIVTTPLDELNDNGKCSLREAIEAANTNTAVDDCQAGSSGPDTIIFATKLNNMPIVLSGAADDDKNKTGDLDIHDGGNLTILGNDAKVTIIDGGGIDRVFHVCPGGGCKIVVTFRELTIQNGTVTGDGGGIYSEAGVTIIDDSSIISNCPYILYS